MLENYLTPSRAPSPPPTCCLAALHETSMGGDVVKVVAAAEVKAMVTNSGSVPPSHNESVGCPQMQLQEPQVRRLSIRETLPISESAPLVAVLGRRKSV